MSSEKRKAQYREASKKNRARKKAIGLISYRREVTPEEKIQLDQYLIELRK